MIEIIMDEKAWCESAIDNLYLGSSPVETLCRIARYYCSQGYKKSQVAKLLEDYLLRCNPSANIVRWQQAIDYCVKQMDKWPLIDIGAIPITRSELDKIDELDSAHLQRTMFTLLCLAKYKNAVNPKNNGWVNYEKRDIFPLANIKVTTNRQVRIINDLWSRGYIGMSNIVDNVSVNVKIIDDKSEPVLMISDFRNLGNQYMRLHSSGYIECRNCGVVIKPTAPAQKYCTPCSADMKIVKTIENRRATSRV